MATRGYLIGDGAEYETGAGRDAVSCQTHSGPVSGLQRASRDELLVERHAIGCEAALLDFSGLPNSVNIVTPMQVRLFAVREMELARKLGGTGLELHS